MPPDLDAARRELLADLAAAVPSGSAPGVHAAAPLRPPPEWLRTLIANRVAAGFTQTGTDSPSARALRRVVLPSAVLAVLDLVLLVIAIGTAGTGAVIIAAVLLAIFVGVAVLGAIGARRDPLRFTAAHRLLLESAGHWRSELDWSPSDPAAFGLVADATRSVERAVAAPAWMSLDLDRLGARVDLVAVLDAVDAGAHAAGPAVVDSAPLVDRVAALRCYADQIAAPRPDPDRLASLAEVLAT